MSHSSRSEKQNERTTTIRHTDKKIGKKKKSLLTTKIHDSLINLNVYDVEELQKVNTLMFACHSSNYNYDQRTQIGSRF